MRGCILTPADRDVPPELDPVDREGPNNHLVQIQSLNQHPEEICHLRVVEQSHHTFTYNL